jgi:hypothetical protein
MCRDPARIPNAIEEVLRFDSSVLAQYQHSDICRLFSSPPLHTSLPTVSH